MTRPELTSTLGLLARTYSSPIESSTLVAIIFLLQNEGDMSIRQIAAVLGLWQGSPDVDFLPFIDAASRLEANHPEVLFAKKLLLQNGYAEWLTGD